MELTSEEKALVLKHRKAQRKKITVRELDDISGATRSAEYARLYALARENLDSLIDHGHESKDIENWCYEAVMQLLGDDIFDKINPLL